MTDIADAKVLILATDGFEKSELMEPRRQLREKGATVHVASPKSGEIKSWDKTDWGESVPVDMGLDAVKAEDYDALVLPGGVINPDKLRTEQKAVQLVRDFVGKGKTVAAICHGPWMLAEAGVIEGRDVTSYGSIRTDVENAGGKWHDSEVVVDRGMITSRSPDDLPAFIARIVEEIGEGSHAR
ncbi:MAG: type 1 glutamine amidotransferase domain-containing protein [Sphingomonadales bacterium]